MFRRFFRIGFGGCGCALEEHFRDHAAELSFYLLRKFYLDKLKNWTGKLPREPFETKRVEIISDLNISPEEGKEGGNYAGKFFENLNKIIAELDSWKGSLGGAKDTVMSYEGAIIDVLIQNVTKMKDEAKSIKNRGSVLLESLPVDSFTKTETEKYKRFYTYNQNITETRELIIEQFGHAVIESQGFNHRPELQMLPFSIKEVRDEVFKKIRDHITSEKLSSLTSQGYFFYVGLGGGTGTGVISPLAEKFGKGSYGYFALAVLGAEKDNERMKSQQPWFRRCFNMLIALNDLIVTAELDGLILVDNARLIQAVDEEQGKREKTKTKGKQLVKVEEQPKKLSEQKQTAKMGQPDETPNDGLKGTPLMTKVDEKLIKALYPAFGITTLENGDFDLDWSQLRGPIGLHTLKNKPPIIVPCHASGPCEDFLFSWENVPGDKDGKLISFLREDLKLTWAENVTIKPTDNNTIIIGNGNDSAEMVISDDKSKVTVKIDDKSKGLKVRSLKVREVDGGLNIYKSTITDLINAALSDKGMLTRCEYETNKPERVFVYVRCITDEEEVRDALANAFGRKKEEIAIIKEHLFCWDDVVETDDYTDLKRFLKDGDLCNISWADEAVPGKKDKNELVFCKKGPYLFSWPFDPGNVDERENLKKNLKDKFSIGWVDNAVFPKSDDGNTISIRNGGNSAEIMIDEKNEKATLKLNDGNTHDLTVKKENNKLNIYKGSDECVTLQIGRHLFDWVDGRIENEEELEKYLKKKEIEWGYHFTKDGKVITIGKDERQAKITLDEKNERATLSWGEEGEKGKEQHLGAKRPYLFSWPFDPENVDERENLKKNLKEYLKDKSDIGWVENAVFPKSGDGNTISICNDENVEKITIDVNKKDKKATLKINDGNPDDLTVKEEKNKLKIYVDKWKIYSPNEVDITITGKQEVPLLGVKTWNGKHYLYLKGSKSSILWVKKNLEKTIVVFESQEIGSFWHEREKENEVLILLVNPDVKKALEKRLEEGKKFVDLLVTFKDLLEASTSEDKSETAKQIVDAGGDIKKVSSIKRDDEKVVEKWNSLWEEQLNKISNVGIEEKEKDKKKLEEAMNFLLPRELYEKNEDIYEYMKGVLERLNREAEFLNDYLNGKRDWPIFREKIFNIISTSGKRDEVILSAISAIGDETKKKFDKLVGDAYASYLGTFERQFFKYTPSYIYQYQARDNILSDDAENLLPGELKNKINKFNEKQRKGTGSDAQSSKKFEEKKKEELAKLVEDNLNEPAHLFFIPAKDENDNDRWPDLRKSWDNDHNHKDLKALFIQNKVIPSEETVYVRGKYLFEWGKCPGDDDERFREFLSKDLNVDWAKNAEFFKSNDGKSDDGKTINIRNDENSRIVIDEKNEKATLIINVDSTLPEIKVEEYKDKGKRYVYKVDDNERTVINIEEDAEKIYSIKNKRKRIDVYGPTDLSFPAMLALAGLYADWQYLLSWNESQEIQERKQKELKGKLFENDKPELDFKICASSEAKDNKCGTTLNLLIIDEKKEEATLIARRSSVVLFKWNPDESPNLEGKLPPALVERFDSVLHVDVDPSKGWGLEELGKPKEWRIHSKDSNTYYYLTEKEKHFEITGDRVHELKVKVEKVREGSKAEKKSKTLKIYKRWGEKFTAAEADGEAKNE